MPFEEKLSIEEKLSNIYKVDTTSSLLTVQFTKDTTFLIYSTDSASSTPILSSTLAYALQSITPPIVYRSPSTESNGKDYLLLITLIVIALCLLFFVFLIIYCYFCCYKRSSQNSVKMSDISKNNQEDIENAVEIKPVEIEPVEIKPFEIDQIKNSNR
jgi:hypothetical protein